MQFHYIYITTNNIDGKRYIGKRTYTGTDIKNDTYLGSGKYFKNAVKKYGRKNFTKVILQVCETEDEVYEAETWWVYISNANHLDTFYNIANGGKGGQTGMKHSAESLKKMSDANKGKLMSKETCEKMSNSKMGEKNPFYGKCHTEESKKKNAEKHIGHTPWNKGKTNVYSEKTLKEMSDRKKGIPAHNRKQVVCLDKNTNDLVKIYESINDAQDDGFYATHVGKCCRGVLKTTGGYKWMYLDEYNKINNKE